MRELNKRARQHRLTGVYEDGAEFEGADHVPEGPAGEVALKAQIVGVLRDYVAGMNPDNFAVRPHRRAVECFQKGDEWERITDGGIDNTVEDVAALRSERFLGTEPAKRFDLLMLNLQLSLWLSSISQRRALWIHVCSTRARSRTWRRWAQRTSSPSGEPTSSSR